MRKLLFLGAAVLGLSIPAARAADMPIVAKAPPPPPIFSWTGCYLGVNAGGGWDHPIHLHYEEGVTMNRGNQAIPATERLVRKDVWRLRPSGQVTFQVQFGEYGGSYVNHCHNTVHEDFALLMRIQTLVGERPTITQTPNPTPDGVFFTTPEVLPEGNPANPQFFDPNNQPGGGQFNNVIGSINGGNGNG